MNFPKEAKQQIIQFILICISLYQQKQIGILSMSVSNEGTSSEISYSATTGGQLRYKKALKQITKLVSMNTMLKKQVEAISQNYKKLQVDYINLSDQYEEVTTKYNKLSKSSPLYPATKTNKDFIKVDNQADIQGGNRIFTSEHQLIDEEVEVNFDNLNGNASQRILSQNGESLRVKELEEKICNFQILLNEKEDQIESLHLALQKKHLEMIEMERRIGDLNAKLAKTNSEDKDTSNNFIVVLSEELMNERKKVQFLQSRLVTAQNWAEKIAADYQQLRKESMMVQNSMAIFNQKQKPNVFRNNEAYAQINLRNSDEEVLKLKKEIAEKKKKYKYEIEKLKNEIQNLTDFIAKQQFYIENYVSTEQHKMMTN